MASLSLLALALFLVGGCTTPGDTVKDGAPGPVDADGDGTTVEAGDCNDSDPAVHPGAQEACDGVDSDCNGSVADSFDDYDGDGAPDCVDGDDDGDDDPDASDCAPLNPRVHGAAEDIPDDDIDQDCNGNDTVTCFVDNDGDGTGAEVRLAADGDCEDAREVAYTGDCDDTRRDVYPGAPEACDAIDSDCNGSLVDTFDDLDGDFTPDCVDTDDDGDSDPDASDCSPRDPRIHTSASDTPDDGTDQDCNGTDTITCRVDLDGDGYGGGTTLAADGDCTDVGETSVAGDCDDSDAGDHPGATEIHANGDDEDCDGTESCYADADRDGYRGALTVTSADTDCSDAGEALASTIADCDDARATVHPGATETVGDEQDQDCDGAETCYADADADRYRASATVASIDLDCTDAGEAASSVTSGDCDDADGAVHPGVSETVGDARDANCDGAETCYADADRDGYRSASTVASADTDCSDAGEALASVIADCDDARATVHPGATETLGDEQDQDCDGAETCYVDADADRYRASATVASIDLDCTDAGEAASSVTSGDCDDADGAVHPGVSETVGDARDANCDGAETCYADADRDGYRVSTTVASGDTDCSDAGEALASATADCDDARAAVYPGGVETAGDGIDSDCDGTETCYADGDRDGYRTSSTRTSVDTDCSDAGEALATATSGDCDDAISSVHPGATETVDDDRDSDCDGYDGTRCYADADADGYAGTTRDSVDDDCADSGEYASATDCDDADADANPGVAEDTLDACIDGIDQDCDGDADFDDAECACSAVGAALAGEIVSCPDPTLFTILEGRSGSFTVEEATTQYHAAAAGSGHTAWSTAFSAYSGMDACTTPVFVRASADTRGFLMGTDPSTAEAAVPYWLGPSVTAASTVRSGIPQQENCSLSTTSATCLFPATPSTMPDVGCYAVSFTAPPAAAGSAATVVATMDRTGEASERIDIHAVIATGAGITQDQVLDTLSYAARYFETQGVSLGDVSFETISGFSYVDLSTDWATLVRTPTRAGASQRAVTVIFVADIVDSGVAGLSSGIPGLQGTTGTAGSGVFVETAFLSGRSGPWEMLGLDVAHEVGHYLGLRHTSEIAAPRNHDFLTDTLECDPASSLDESVCAAFGADNVMFPILGDVGASFSTQQGQVLAALAPHEATPCVSHATCGDDEICGVTTGVCERAWARDYTFSVTAASVSSSITWDVGSAPDLFAYYSTGPDDGTTSAVSNSYTAYWYDTLRFTALKSSSYLYVGLYDEDVYSDDTVDTFYVPAPIPISYLRSPYYYEYGTYSVALLGLEPM